MRIHSKRFLGFPVQTQTGTSLGRVSGFEFDTDTGRLTALSVRARGVVSGLLDQDLFVAWPQIVEITETAVIVKDAAMKSGIRAVAARPAESALGEAGISAMHRTET